MGDSAMAAPAAASIIAVEEQRPAPVPGEAAPATIATEGQKVSSESISCTGRRSKSEGLMKRSFLILRTGAFVFSFLSFLFMASNQKGGSGWMDFRNYEEYRYLLSVSSVTCFYTIFQIPRQIHQMLTGKEIVPRSAIFYIEFAGDQTMAYMLLSASSAAFPVTDKMRLSNDNEFTDNALASISMALVAFFCLAASSLVSGFKLAIHAHV